MPLRFLIFFQLASPRAKLQFCFVFLIIKRRSNLLFLSSPRAVLTLFLLLEICSQLRWRFLFKITMSSVCVQNWIFNWIYWTFVIKRAGEEARKTGNNENPIEPVPCALKRQVWRLLDLTYISFFKFVICKKNWNTFHIFQLWGHG